MAMNPPRHSSRKTISPVRFGFEATTVSDDASCNSGSVEVDTRDYESPEPFVPTATLPDGARYYRHKISTFTEMLEHLYGENVHLVSHEEKMKAREDFDRNQELWFLDERDGGPKPPRSTELVKSHLKKKDHVWFYQNGWRVAAEVINVTKQMAQVKIFRDGAVVSKKKSNLMLISSDY